MEMGGLHLNKMMLPTHQILATTCRSQRHITRKSADVCNISQTARRVHCRTWVVLGGGGGGGVEVLKEISTFLISLYYHQGKTDKCKYEAMHVYEGYGFHLSDARHTEHLRNN